VINIEVASYCGKVTPSECVIVKANETHYFNAEENAKFIVADTENLPSHILHSEHIVFSISAPLLSFLAFSESQLKHQINPKIEALMFATFYKLLEEQKLFFQYDHRIREVVFYITHNLSKTLTIDVLANIACLSPTQLKKNFKAQTEQTLTEYITKLRMQKAQALLLHTDSPIAIVAELIGYTDVSAFSRRFSQYFGVAPSTLKHV
jgi:AraC-like DNA-binding protein